MENEQNIPKAMDNMIKEVRSGLRFMSDKGFYCTTALVSLHKIDASISLLSEFYSRFTPGSAAAQQDG